LTVVRRETELLCPNNLVVAECPGHLQHVGETQLPWSRGSTHLESYPVTSSFTTHTRSSEALYQQRQHSSSPQPQPQPSQSARPLSSFGPQQSATLKPFHVNNSLHAIQPTVFYDTSRSAQGLTTPQRNHTSSAPSLPLAEVPPPLYSEQHTLSPHDHFQDVPPPSYTEVIASQQGFQS
jgi:hypothetical protein